MQYMEEYCFKEGDISTLAWFLCFGVDEKPPSLTSLQGIEKYQIAYLSGYLVILEVLLAATFHKGKRSEWRSPLKNFKRKCLKSALEKSKAWKFISENGRRWLNNTSYVYQKKSSDITQLRIEKWKTFLEVRRVSQDNLPTQQYVDLQCEFEVIWEEEENRILGEKIRAATKRVSRALAHKTIHLASVARASARNQELYSPQLNSYKSKEYFLKQRRIIASKLTGDSKLNEKIIRKHAEKIQCQLQDSHQSKNPHTYNFLLNENGSVPCLTNIMEQLRDAAWLNLD
jgi:hypothetical protein